jgi:hypothetical protein
MCLNIIVFTGVIFAIAYFSHPNFSSVLRGVFPRISRPSIQHLGMVTHSYCRSCQSVTSFVFKKCGISAVLSRTLGLYYNAETFHFKFMNRIPNSGPNLKVTYKTTPSKSSSHNFRTPVFWRENWPKKCEHYASKYGIRTNPMERVFFGKLTAIQSIKKCLALVFMPPPTVVLQYYCMSARVTESVP